MGKAAPKARQVGVLDERRGRTARETLQTGEPTWLEATAASRLLVDGERGVC